MFKPDKHDANHPAIGERFVIHAGARPVRPYEVEELLHRLGRKNDHTGLVVEPARQLLQRVRDAYKCRLLPLGAALGTAVIGEPKLSPDIFGLEVSDSDRGKFNWGWPLSELRPFSAPIPMKGSQGFFNVNIQEADAA